MVTATETTAQPENADAWEAYKTLVRYFLSLSKDAVYPGDHPLNFHDKKFDAHRKCLKDIINLIGVE